MCRGRVSFFATEGSMGANKKRRLTGVSSDPKATEVYQTPHSVNEKGRAKKSKTELTPLEKECKLRNGSVDHPTTNVDTESSGAAAKASKTEGDCGWKGMGLESGKKRLRAGVPAKAEAKAARASGTPSMEALFGDGSSCHDEAFNYIQSAIESDSLEMEMLQETDELNDKQKEKRGAQKLEHLSGVAYNLRALQGGWRDLGLSKEDKQRAKDLETMANGKFNSKPTIGNRFRAAHKVGSARGDEYK